MHAYIRTYILKYTYNTHACIHTYCVCISLTCNFVLVDQKQYIFIHDTIMEAIKVGNTQIEVMNLRKKLNELGALDPETDQSGIEAEFGVS